MLRTFVGVLNCVACGYALWFTGIIVFAGLASMPPTAYVVYGVAITSIIVRLLMHEGSLYEDSLVFFGKAYMRMRGTPFRSDEEARETVRAAIEAERAREDPTNNKEGEQE